MNLRQLESFLAIVDLGSFASAADRLCVTQSTVSARIHELEQLLGVDLFDRSQRTVRLTMKGRDLVDRARKIIALAADLRREIGTSDAVTGVVRVGVVEMVAVSWLPQFVHSAKDTFPNIKLEFEVGLNPLVLGELRSGRIDIAIIAGDMGEMGMETLPLGTADFAWMASPSFGNGKHVLDADELKNMSILYQGDDSFTSALIDKLLHQSTNRRRGTTCSSLEALFTMVRAGVGVALLPIDHYSNSIARGEIQMLKTRPKSISMPFSVLYPTRSSSIFSDLAQICVQVCSFDKPKRLIARSQDKHT